METANEIKGAISNIQYYGEEVRKLARKQMDKDVALGHQLGIDTSAGSVRFNSIGAMDTAAEMIGIYCQNILANIEAAEKQDKLLFVPEE